MQSNIPTSKPYFESIYLNIICVLITINCLICGIFNPLNLVHKDRKVVMY